MLIFDVLSRRKEGEDWRVVGAVNAPDVDTMEFFATQLVDEARHSAVFRGHLLDLGVSRDELFSTIARVIPTRSADAVTTGCTSVPTPPASAE